MPSVKHSKQEVRNFLVSRRAKVTPQQAGLSHYGGNRRVPGLRREEVALLAGVSLDYYSRLEKGNIAGVSDAVLNAISNALNLDEAERAHLHDLARAANSSSTRAGRASSRRVRVGLQLVLDGMVGMPAFVSNGRMDVLAWNDLAAAMYSPMFTAAVSTPNFARFNILDPAAKDFYPDWGKVVETTARMLRTEVGRSPHDTDLSNLIGELSTRSEEFARRWATHDVRLHRAGVKHFRHPDVGELELHYEVLPVSADEGQTLTVYAAEPGSTTAESLQLLSNLAATSRIEQPQANPSAEQQRPAGLDPEDEHTF